MVSIDDLLKVVLGLFKEPIIGPINSKMAKIGHLEYRHDVIFFCRGWSDLDKISVTGDMSTAVMWSKSKPDVQLIWRTFRRIQRHVIPEPPAIMQVAATCEFNVMIPELRVTLQGAATGRIQWHVIPEPRITLHGATTW